MQLLNIILLSILLPALSISGISIQDSGRNYVSESVVSILGVASASQVAAQPYRFNAKEDQSFTGVPLLDYGARFYNPALARWTTRICLQRSITYIKFDQSGKFYLTFRTGHI